MEYIIEICVALDIAILGIAYPIIVDKVSSIGDKFSSLYIANVFENTFPQKAITIRLQSREFKNSWFKLVIYFTLLTLVSKIISFNLNFNEILLDEPTGYFDLLFATFKVPQWFGIYKWIKINFVDFLVFTSSSTLIIFFFIWLDKVALFNGKATSLLRHLIKMYKSLENDSEIKIYCLKSINELTYYSIEKQDEHLQGTLLDFYFEIFSSIQQDNDRNTPLVYPNDLYQFVYKLNYILADNSIKNRKIQDIEHRAVSGIWLLGEWYQGNIISRDTYNVIWLNLTTICDSPKLLKMYWANVSQYFDHNLNQARAYNSNNEQDNSKEDERDTFLEFHYALGGLLLYRKQYDVIKYNFEYSQSLPLKHPLLPQSIDTIFDCFLQFSNEYNEIIPYDLIYPFPELDNLGNRRRVIFWICKYMSLLFLRQFYMRESYMFQNFTRQPNLPEEIPKLYTWLKEIEYFEFCLSNILNETHLLKELHFTSEEINKDRTKEYLSKLKTSINSKISYQKSNNPLSKKKIEKFNESTRNIISRAFDAQKSLLNVYAEENINEKEDLKLWISGWSTLVPKSDFTDNDTVVINSDSIFARQIADSRVKDFVTDSFFAAKSRHYLLRKNQLIDGLDRVIKKNKDIIIVCVNFFEKEILESSKYNNILIYAFTNDRNIRNVFFILEKKYLPVIKYNKLNKEEIEKYQLQLIDNEHMIYTSIVDINSKGNENIKSEWPLEDSVKEQESKEVELKVQVTITYSTVIYWHKDREVVLIALNTQYKEQGIINDLNEIIGLSASEN